MPRDTQIFSGADHAGNSDYTLPGNSEIAVLAVNATFKDNGAGADWCPAVVMLSDSGHVIARAMLPDVKVTAGGDAEVSFFPGVKPSALSGAAGAVAYTRGLYSHGLLGDPPFTVTAGNTARSPFSQLDVSDPTVFNWTTSTSTNDTLELLKNGVYLVIGASSWENNAFPHTSFLQGPDLDLGRFGNGPANITADANPYGGQGFWLIQPEMYVAEFAPDVLFLELTNLDGVNRNMTDATLGVVYLGPT